MRLRSRPARRSGESWPESVRLAVVKSVLHLDANRELARLALLRLSLLPEVSGSRHTAISEGIVSIALRGAPLPNHGGALIPDALVGVVHELLTWAVTQGAFARLPALADHLSFFLLAPYLGGELAAQAVIASADAEWLGRHSGQE